MKINKAIKMINNIKIVYKNKSLYFEKGTKEFIIHEKSQSGEGWNRTKNEKKAIEILLDN